MTVGPGPAAGAVGERPDGIVLCGGRSRRFGGDKAQALVGGRAVLDRVLDVVVPLCARVLVVTGGDGGGLRLPDGVELVVDAFPGAGPLGGICTGLRHGRADLALVVGGDMPFLNGELLGFLLGLAPGFDAVAPRLADGRVQPLHAVYGRACLPVMERHLASGQLAAWRVPTDVRTRFVGPEEMLPRDPEMLSFFSLNTPEDLARAEEIAGGG